MSWAVFRNNRPLALAEIPGLAAGEWRSAVEAEFREPRRVVAFFARPGPTPRLLLVLADDDRSRLLVNSLELGADRAFPSLTPEIPAFHLFERELFEESGIVPQGHPWLKPVRYGSARSGSGPKPEMAAYPFFEMEGEEVHEVGVGPIHAGVIEPGHFRFMCHGEAVHHLEIQLGYQHRGLEALFLKESRAGLDHRLPHLAESVAGDTAVGHALAWAAAWEALAGVEAPQRAMAIRGLGLELERAAVHLGGLGALCNDIAYLTGSAVYQAERTRVINGLMSLCGSRFGRGLVRAGGVGEDIPAERAVEVKAVLAGVRERAAAMGELLFASAGVLARFERTGAVSPETARRIGMVGLAARASGVAVDVRSDHPFGIFRFAPLFKRTMESGDVLARAFLRHVEFQESLDFAMARLDDLPPGKWRTSLPAALAPDRMVVSLVEGWRGEIAHVAVSDEAGRLAGYKIKDPSFHNWFGLALAVRGNEISDFPLCNKSFDLSYCGHDL